MPEVRFGARYTIRRHLRPKSIRGLPAEYLEKETPERPYIVHLLLMRSF